MNNYCDALAIIEKTLYNMVKGKTCHNIYLWQNAMNVSKDNWVINEIDFEEFNALK